MIRLNNVDGDITVCYDDAILWQEAATEAKEQKAPSRESCNMRSPE